MARSTLLVALLWLGVGALGLSLLGSGAPPAAPEAAASEAAAPWPPAPPSVVFGPPGEPVSGQIMVGVLLPYPPTARLIDRLGPEALARFEREEAARGAGTPGPLPSEGATLEVLEAPEGPGGWREAGESFRRLLALAAASVRRSTGVRVSFQLLPAARAAEVPLLLVRPGFLFAGDREALARAAALGVRVVGAAGAPATEPQPGLFGPPPAFELQPPALAALITEVVRSSPRLLRAPEDPLAVRAARREGGWVHVDLAAPPSSAALEDHLGRPVGAVAQDGAGRLRFAAPEPGLDARRTRLVLGARVAGRLLRRAYVLADLVGALDRLVLAPRSVEAGSDLAPRVLVTNSLTGAPVAGASERLRLEAGRPPVLLAEAAGQTDESGSLAAVLHVPDGAPPGPAALVVGEERLAVELRPGLRLSLVTERALYRPTDEVCARLMAHRAGNGRPVADLPVILTLGAVEKRVRTSAHGIASARFRLTDAPLGPTELRAEAQGVRARAAFTVRAFDLPTFSVAVEPESLTLHPGEAAPVGVRARYTDGAPVVGAQVEAWGGTPLLPEVRRGRTDADGRLELVVTAGRAGESDAFVVEVTDADGRRGRASVAVRRAGRTLREEVSVEPLADLVVGRPGRIALLAHAPGPLSVAVDAAPPRTLALDAEGRALLDLVPAGPEVRLDLSLGAAAPVGVRLAALVPDPARVLVLPSRRAWRVGETLELTLLGPDGPAWLDLDRGDLTVATASARLVGGEARLRFPLEEGHAGVLTLRAWRLAAGGAGRAPEPVGSATGLLVVRGRSLDVAASPRQPAYRPGATADLDVRVTDRAGRPVRGVLGWWGVDEALLRLMPWRTGAETVFDVLPAGASAEDAARAAEPVERGLAADAASLERLVGPAGRPFERLTSERPARWSDALRAAERLPAEREAAVDAAVDRLEEAVAAAFARLPLEGLRTAGSLPQMLEAVRAAGTLAPEALLDPWGTPFELASPPVPEEGREGRSRELWGLRVASAGPDLLHSTADDVEALFDAPTAAQVGGRVGRFLELYRTASLRPMAESLTAVAERTEWVVFEETEGEIQPQEVVAFAGPMSNALLGTGGAAGGAFAGRGASKRVAGGGGRERSDAAPVPVRRDFEPTLVFVPEAPLGPDGCAHLRVRLKDALTTWRLRLVASADDGAVGTGEARLVATQPLAAEPWTVRHLTVGDEVDLPVALRNGTEAPLRLDVRLTLSDGLLVLGPARGEAEIGPRGTGACTFRLRAVAPGPARVRVEARADAEGLADVVEREVAVAPDARPVVETQSGTVEEGRPLHLALAPPPEGRPSERRVMAFPAPLTEVLSSFEGLIACPHG